MKRLFFILLICLSANSMAEYRAYRLGIKYYPEDKNEPEVEVISNLDNIQYESYYKITPQQQTRIIRHWMCWGRTDYEQEYCMEPPKSLDVRAPAQVLSPSTPSSVIK